MAKRKTSPSNSQSLNSGSTIRFEQPKSSRQHQSKTMIAAPEIHPVNGFVEFLREHSVVSIAIAFVIGIQAQKLVTQLVASFIDPLFKLLFGQALSQRDFTLHLNGRSVPFGWGAFIYGLLNFIFVLAAIYAMVKIFKLDKLDKPKSKGD
ncbi:MAG TPA: MscL family protein [Candidatus Saccharimonadales bacterium]|nr:MscL family protein [Candidatus Saccharimonadales bacterium]